MQEAAGANQFARKSGLDPTVATGLVGVLIFFILSGAIAYYNLQTVREDNQKIIHSHEVITALDSLLSDAQDAETGQRGYLLTGDVKYLDPYNAALASIPAKLNDIPQLTSDNPIQQPKIASLKSHIAAKLAELKETIDLR